MGELPSESTAEERGRAKNLPPECLRYALAGTGNGEEQDASHAKATNFFSWHTDPFDFFRVPRAKANRAFDAMQSAKQ